MLFLFRNGLKKENHQNKQKEGNHRYQNQIKRIEFNVNFEFGNKEFYPKLYYVPNISSGVKKDKKIKENYGIKPSNARKTKWEEI